MVQAYGCMQSPIFFFFLKKSKWGQQMESILVPAWTANAFQLHEADKK